jgi:lipopolysaccharide/colanic/teichoic acid biosynthesis glycosyltransferase
VVIDLRAPSAAPADLDASRGLLAAPRWKLAVKRLVDIAGAGFAIVVLSPLLLAVALAVVTTSRGPLFFVSPRVGRHGKTFRFFKFRSMRNGAAYEKPALHVLNEKDGPIFKVKDDPRITRVGRTMRKLSLDELPQLFHVLTGRMSLVGPRPHLPDEVSHYSERDAQRLLVKPGITCIWQVSGRSDLDFATWVNMDLEYIQEWSLWMDIKLMLRTIPAVLAGRGAY